MSMLYDVMRHPLHGGSFHDSWIDVAVGFALSDTTAPGLLGGVRQVATVLKGPTPALLTAYTHVHREKLMKFNK